MTTDLPVFPGKFPRFVAEHPRDRRRIAMGSRALIGGGGQLLALAARSSPHRAAHTATRWWAGAATRLLRLGIRTEGLEHVDADERYLVVSLHEGFADVLALLRLPLDLRFAARDELFAWPHLGRYLRATSQVRVDENPSRASLRRFYGEVEAAFDAGESLVLFPQGTILGVEVAFRRGTSRIARRFDRPVLPVVLTGGHRVWEHPYSPLVRLDQSMAMHVLPPIPGAHFTPTRARTVERHMKKLALSAAAPVRHYVPERDGWWDDYQFEIDADFGDVAAQVADHRSSLTG